MNRRAIALTCSILLVLLGVGVIALMPGLPTLIIGGLMAISGVSTFAKTI